MLVIRCMAISHCVSAKLAGCEGILRTYAKVLEDVIIVVVLIKVLLRRDVLTNDMGMRVGIRTIFPINNVEEVAERVGERYDNLRVTLEVSIVGKMENYSILSIKILDQLPRFHEFFQLYILLPNIFSV